MAVNFTFDVTIWLLVFCRVGAILMMLPGLGDDSLPARVKLVIGLLLALAIAPVVTARFPSEAADGLQLGSMIVSELIVGMIFGSLVRIMFSGIMTAGTIISTQTGLSMAAVFDPSMGAENPVLARFLSLAATVLLFEMDVHHLFIVGMVHSYAIFHPGGQLMFGDIAHLGLATMSKAFGIGVQISAPFLLYGFLFNVALGFISRLTPAFQVFFVAQPLNLLFSFGLFMVSAGLMLSVFMNYFVDSVRTIVG